MEGKVYLDASSTEENNVPIEEYIRQLVKDEVAAQLSQMQAKPIAIDHVKVREPVNEYLDKYKRQPLTLGEADSQNKTWESAKDTTWQNEPVYLSESHERLCRLGVKVPL